MLKVRIGNELILLNLLVLALIIAIILFPSNALRIALGLLFLLFFPGYTLMAAIFPKREGIDAIERIALSFGMSIAIVPLVGLILNYTPWGIRLEPVLYSVSSFIFVTSIIAWVRRRRLPERNRFGIEFQLILPSWNRSVGDRVLLVVLVTAILGALGTLGYAVAKPKVEESFTEFCILGLSGKVADYPKEVKVSGEGKVIVGIVNHEQEVVSYRIEVKIDGVKNNEVRPVVLAHKQRWEGIVSFVPDNIGDNQKVEFLLYKNAEDKASYKLHLWLDVTQ